MARFERWLEVKRIFEEALETAPEKRDAFLDQACRGDTELRQEVHALLNAPALPTSSLASLLGLPDRRDEPDYAEGDCVDHFTIVRELGKGGMGMVYEARDTRNNDRRVAVKVLFSRAVKLSQDKRLAGLTHPSIVTFHDSGETAEGLPYFVFEYIEGEPITAYCERRTLGVPERLRLFEKVCEAVAYAHQRLVIHCDLKPENILVTATGELKLLDFGIAKEVGAAGSATGEPSPITLPFASPEQVGNEETTTLSDVYSLGVLLSVLLAGRLPYRNARTVAELRDAILHEEPSRTSELAILPGGAVEDSPLSAAAPPTKSPADLVRRLRGDLDAIVAKALRKEPARRYQSAADLASDVARHLGILPVSARGTSHVYRTGKLLRRNRGTAAIVALFVLFALVSLGVWLRQYRETVRQRDAARQEATRAEEVSKYLTELFRVSDPERKPGGAVSARELLDQATTALKSRLMTQPRTKIRLLNTLGEIYQNLGLFDAARPCHENALSLARSRLASDDLLLADTLSDLGATLTHQGKFPEALAYERQSLALRRRRLPEQHLDVARSILEIGTTFAAQHTYREAEPVLRDAVQRLRSAKPPAPEIRAEALNTLGGMLADDRQLDAAETAMRECLSLRQRIYGAKHPRVAATLTNLATILEIHARFTEAEKLQRQALAINREVLGESHPDTLATLGGLGFIQLVARKLPSAIDTFQETLKLAHANTDREDPLGVEIRLDLARALLTAKRVSEGLAVLGEAYDVGVKRLGRDDWLVANIIKAQAEGLMMRGDLHASENKFRDAMRLFQAKQGERGYTVIASKAELGTVLGREGKFTEAEPLLLGFYRQATEREKPDAADRLVLLYEAWGKLDKANEYRKFGTP